MRKLYLSLLLFPLLGFAPLGCTKERESRVVDIRSFPLDSTSGVITHSGVELDKGVSADGGGSLKVTVQEAGEGPAVVRLFELGDLDVEDARLLYSARLRTEGVEGRVYLEMWCHFPSGGNFFSRGLDNPLSGTTDWTAQEIPFFLKKGQNPDNVTLNLVVDGKGTAWIDAIVVRAAPLEQ